MRKGIINNLVIIGGLLLLVAIAAIAYILRPTVAPSGEITAMPIQVENTETSEIAEVIPTDLSPTAETATQTVVVEETNNPASQIYEIAQEESQVSFSIDEILRGQDKTVVGVTNELVGQILIDFNDPAASQLGLIQVNARTFVTDNENRNRAIRNQILDVDEFEFVTFSPTSLAGMSESISIGETVDFRITGDLTVRHVTREVSFNASVTLESLDRISGHASTTIEREDYELTIPQVTAVAGVSQTVILEINFLALSQ